ncbi:sigma-70 family RNA polymerase sigma factor [Streptomyces sp. NPDC007901]|uniref:sigma-70 family RNA polymerase sigma factor n=1 Tax=Streptomyces sp. NPDC007901 TaxID=3364785 RepID=UPI0036EA1BE8
MTITDTTTRPASEAEQPVAAIVDRARGGDREAFGVLYARYQPQIYAYLLRRTGDRQLSEDLTGDVFVRALTRIGTFTWRGSDIGAWLNTIARNLLFDYFRSSRFRREWPTADMRDHDQAVTDAVDQVTDRLALAPVVGELRKAITGLTPDQQECLRLRWWHDLPFAEVGRRMNRSGHAAQILHRRALSNLSAPHIKAALSGPARPEAGIPPGTFAASTTSPLLPGQNTPGRTRPMATPDATVTLTPLTASQAVALVLLREGYRERSITQRTGVTADTLYPLAATHHITAPHGTVEGHRCHEAADTEPCDGCSLADGRDQARARARHRKSLGSLPRSLQRQATRRTAHRTAAR